MMRVKTKWALEIAVKKFVRITFRKAALPITA